jgi:CubicO group peptidase (beta-lactamase class C family)
MPYLPARLRHSLVAGLLFGSAIAQAQEPYFPSASGLWEKIDPEKAGFDPEKLAKAVEFAKANESSHPRDYSNQVATFGRLLGPIPKERGATNGVILRKGRIVAEWGDTDQIEPTYSAAKSYLSTLAGIAVDRGLIKSVDDPVANYLTDAGYYSPQNAKVTWAHHLWQTSEWEGTLWDKPHTFLGEAEFGSGRRPARELKEPGSYYEYNDVRINRLALSLTRLFGRGLSDVLKTEILDPIGATERWRYMGYDNSVIEIEGKKVQSVTGGTRWGGGLWITTRNQARFGLLFLRTGNWAGKQVISKEWIDRATKPSPQKADYGMLWWLNTGRRAWPALSEKAYAAVGFGSNTIWIDPEKDLVVVWRWHAGNGSALLQRVVDAMR